jgi:HEAT repeat protein
MQWMKHRSCTTKSVAARIIGDIGPDAHKAVPALIQAMQNMRDDDVRTAAAIALRKVDPKGPLDKKSQQVLARLLCSSNPEVQKTAGRLLLRGKVVPKELLSVRFVLSVYEGSEASRAKSREFLRKVGPAAVPVLMKYLTRNDPRARRLPAAAAVALGCLGPQAKDGVPELRKLLEKENTAAAAITALGRIGPDARAAVSTLTKILKSGKYRDETVTALGGIGADARAAVPAIAAGLTGKVRDFKHEKIAARALGRIGGDAARAALVARSKDMASANRDARVRAIRVVAEGGRLMEAELLGARTHSDVSVRFWAIDGLGKIAGQSKKALEALTKALEDKSEATRSRAALALRNAGAPAQASAARIREILGPARTRPATERTGAAGESATVELLGLEEILEGADTGARRRVPSQLAPFGPAARRIMEKALAHKDLEVRARAAKHLSTIYTAVEEVRILNRLGKDAKDDYVLRCVMEAMKHMGPLAAQALPALSAGVKSKSYETGRTAVDALGFLGPEVAAGMPVFSEALSSEHATIQESALVKLRDLGASAKPALPAIRKLLSHKKRSVRRRAAEAMKIIQSSR